MFYQAILSQPILALPVIHVNRTPSPLSLKQTEIVESERWTVWSVRRDEVMRARMLLGQPSRNWSKYTSVNLAETFYPSAL